MSPAARPVQLMLTGVPELDAKLKDLGKQGIRISRNVLMTGGRVVQKEIRKLAKSVAPKIGPTIGLRVGRGKSTRLECKVGVNVGKQVPGKQKRWAPLIVLGSTQRTRKRLGGLFGYIKNPTAQQLSTGRLMPKPIVQQGYSNAQAKMNGAMKRAFDRLLEKELAKAKLHK